MAPKYTPNPDGTVTMTLDNGMTSSFIDPNGEHKNWGAPAAPQDVQALVNAPPSAMPGGNIRQPVANMPPVAAPPDTAAGKPLPNTAEAPMRVTPEPLVIPGSAGTADTTTTTHVTGGTQGTSGLAPADKAKVEAANQEASAAQHAAVNETADQNQKVALNHAMLAQTQFDAGKAKEAGALKAQDEYATAYKSAIDERAAARARKISPSEAFGDDRGAYAFLATMGAAIANVGRAWMGQAMQPITVIDDLVNRSVKLQMAQRESDALAAGEKADVSHEAMLAAKSDAHEGAAQWAAAQTALSKSAEEAATYKALAAQQSAAAAQADAERARSIASTVTSSTTNQTHTAIKSAPTGAGPSLMVPGAQRAEQESQVLHDAAARMLPGAKPRDIMRAVNDFTEQRRNQAAARDSIRHAQELMKQFGGAPGFNRFTGETPRLLTGDEGAAMQQAMQSVGQQVRQALGASTSQGEAERLDKLLHGRGDQASIERGLAQVMSELDAKDRQTRAQYAPLYAAQDWIQSHQGDARALGGAGVAQQAASVAPDDAEEPEEP
jgi:hypothetical protein